MDAAGLLAEVLLPLFTSLPPSAQQQLLQYVVQHWQELKAQTAVVTALQDTYFVETGDQSLPIVCRCACFSHTIKWSVLFVR